MSGFGFLSPLLLGLSALAIPIFLLYMLRLRRTDTPISSTFLWQQLVRDREANAPWQRLRPSWLMLLQLLILAALVLALARPFREVKTITTGRIVLLLDASASMNATDAGDGQSRFERAQELALDTVDTLGADDTMTVIRVAEVPEVLAAATRDRDILRDAIRDTEPSDGSADWGAAFTLAAAGESGVDTLRVVVLSDGGLSERLPEVPGEVKYVEVGQSNDNVAITALSTRALPNAPPQVFAQISNFGERDTTVIFALQLDDRLYSSEFIDVPAQTNRDVIIEGLPDNFTRLKALISQPSSVDVPDYLENDNVAYAINAESSTGKVLLISDGNIFLEQVFSSLPGIDLTISSPDRALPGGDYDLIVYDSVVAEMPTTTDLLFVDPPESTRFFEVVGTSTDTAISPETGGVSQDDDRTRFVNFANVNIRKYRTLDEFDVWATVLVETEAGGPLVLAGDHDSQQVAVITFALADSDLPLQLTWPILVARLMEWYRPQRAISIDSLSPGDALVIRPSVDADEVRIEMPDGDRVEFDLDESPELAFAETEMPGFYRIDVLLDGDVVQEDFFAVNLFDVNESNITPVDQLLVQSSTGETSIQDTELEEVGRRELWAYLALLGLMLLAVEWWYYHRTLTRKPKVTITGILNTSPSPPTKRRWWQRSLTR